MVSLSIIDQAVEVGFDIHSIEFLAAIVEDAAGDNHQIDLLSTLEDVIDFCVAHPLFD